MLHSTPGVIKQQEDAVHTTVLLRDGCCGDASHSAVSWGGKYHTHTHTTQKNHQDKQPNHQWLVNSSCIQKFLLEVCHQMPLKKNYFFVMPHMTLVFSNKYLVQGSKTSSFRHTELLKQEMIQHEYDLSPSDEVCRHLVLLNHRIASGRTLSRVFNMPGNIIKY